MIGEAIAPIFAPLGWGIPEAAVAVIMGLLAKETVVASLGTLFGVGEEMLGETLVNVFTPLSAYSLMVFVLLYMPCLAAMLTIKQETSWRFATGAASDVCCRLGGVLYCVSGRGSSWLRVIRSGRQCLSWLP